MTKEQALHGFFSQFLTAYEENTVPDDAVLPYLTYTVSTGDIQQGATVITCNLWYRDTSWHDINAKAMDIAMALGLGGVKLQCEGGGIWIVKGTPFAQNMTDTDETIRRKYINLLAEYITAY